MKTYKTKHFPSTIKILESTIPGIFKTFMDGGISTLSNKHFKGLSKEFQQNAIDMCNIIVKYGTDEEKQQLMNLYKICLKRINNG